MFPRFAALVYHRKCRIRRANRKLSGRRHTARFWPVRPPAAAEVALPNVFSDHMVLQRKQPNRVWGKASPGEKVVVTIGGQSHEATAAADGAWQVTLTPMEAGGTP